MEWQKNTQSDEKQGPATKITLPSKAIIQNQKTDNKLPRPKEKKKKLKEFITIKPVLQEMLKGFL